MVAVTSQVSHLGLAGSQASSTHSDAQVVADKHTSSQSSGRALAKLESRNQLVEGRLTAAGNTILAATSQGSAASRQLQTMSFWAKVNRLDSLQISLATAIHASDPSRVISDPIVSNPTYRSALKTLVNNNSAWFASHPSSKGVADGLVQRASYLGTSTGTWTDSSGSGTETLQIPSFTPSATDPSVGTLQGFLGTTGLPLGFDYDNIPMTGQKTATGFTFSHINDAKGQVIGLIPSSATISGGTAQGLSGSFELSVQPVDVLFTPVDGKGTLSLPS